jgi:hypothetical protein
MRARVPTAANPMDSMPQRISTRFRCFPMLRWECSHLSERSERSRERVVMQHPVMKSGFSVEAPMSEMNLFKVSLNWTSFLDGHCSSRNLLMGILRDIKWSSNHTPSNQQGQQHDWHSISLSPNRICTFVNSPSQTVIDISGKTQKADDLIFFFPLQVFLVLTLRLCDVRFSYGRLEHFTRKISQVIIIIMACWIQSYFEFIRDQSYTATGKIPLAAFIGSNSVLLYILGKP